MARVGKREVKTGREVRRRVDGDKVGGEGEIEERRGKEKRKEVGETGLKTGREVRRRVAGGKVKRGEAK